MEETYTLDQFFDDFPLQTTANEFPNSTEGRGMPLVEDLKNDEETTDMFRYLLKERSIPVRSTKWGKSLQNCHKKGRIYAESLDDVNNYTIPSPLMSSYLSWILEPPSTPLPYGSLFDLVKATVAKFKPSQIFNTECREGRGASSSHHPEVQYEELFYRGIHDCTYGGVCISPEFVARKT